MCLPQTNGSAPSEIPGPSLPAENPERLLTMASLLASQLSCAMAESGEVDPMVGMLTDYLPMLEPAIVQLVSSQDRDTLDGFLLYAAGVLVSARSASATPAHVAVGAGPPE